MRNTVTSTEVSYVTGEVTPGKKIRRGIVVTTSVRYVILDDCGDVVRVLQAPSPSSVTEVTTERYDVMSLPDGRF